MGNLRVEWQWEVVAHKINGWIVDVDPPATIRHPPSTSLQRIRRLFEKLWTSRGMKTAIEKML
uniref:HDC00913 n=1 Tax=Drosophila melanogaster TaxID=7227 RepID=Q6IHU4_DROME|nr:TPA_inf: HDC00913 [Drosophila melanogaster]